MVPASVGDLTNQGERQFQEICRQYSPQSFDSLLQKLAKEFFRNESQSTSIVQALQILHNPSTEHQAFRDRAYDLHEGVMNDGQMKTWFS